MDEANQSYHPQFSEQSRMQIVRAIIAMAMFEARKEIKRKIQSEGRVKLCKVPHREIERLAKAMVMERRDEFIAKAKASSVVQDEIQRLQAKGRAHASGRLNETRKICTTREALSRSHFRCAKVMIEMEPRDDSGLRTSEH